MGPYVGARGRLSQVDVTKVRGSRWALQPKLDGVYVELHLGGDGRIARSFTRSGRTAARLLRELHGAPLGAPGAVLVGELEALTERSQRALALRGDGPRVHLFDLLHDGSRALRREGYAARRDRLLQLAERWSDPPLPWADDAAGRARDVAGRFVRRERIDGTRFAVVPQWAVGDPEADAVWQAALQGAAEGLVLVALDAPAGAPRAKRKLKPIDTLDAMVVRVSERSLLLRELATFSLFQVARSTWNVAVGSIVAVAHEGYYAGGAPRFPRVVRLRPDLC